MVFLFTVRIILNCYDQYLDIDCLNDEPRENYDPILQCVSASFSSFILVVQQPLSTRFPAAAVQAVEYRAADTHSWRQAGEHLSI